MLFNMFFLRVHTECLGNMTGSCLGTNIVRYIAISAPEHMAFPQQIDDARTPATK